MERKTPLTDDELEATLQGLFRSVDAPAPMPDFTARTMRAVIRGPVPPGRTPLRNPLASLAGWAAVISGVALGAGAAILSQPLLTSGFTFLVAKGVGIGVGLTQFLGTALALLRVFTATGVAVSRAVVTAEGTTAMIVVVVVGALSLTALHRLLTAEGEGSPWQEFS